MMNEQNVDGMREEASGTQVYSIYRRRRRTRLKTLLAPKLLHLFFAPECDLSLYPASTIGDIENERAGLKDNGLRRTAWQVPAKRTPSIVVYMLEDRRDEVV